MPKIEKAPKGNKFKYEIIGISTIFVAIFIAFILLNSNNSGFIGMFLYRVIANVFGANGSWFLVFIVASLGVSIITRNTVEFSFKFQLCSIFLLVTILSIVHLFCIPNLNDAFSLGMKSTGGGIIGGLSLFILYKAIGYYGTIIALTAFLLINILIITKVSFVGFVKKAYAFVKEQISNIKQSKKPQKIKQSSEKDPFIIEGRTSTTASDKHKKKKERKETKITKTSTAESKAVDNSQSDSDQEEPQVVMQLAIPDIEYNTPSLDLLEDFEDLTENNQHSIREQASKIEETLKNFKIESRVTRVSVGPTITRYELQIAAGVKVSRVSSLEDDIALSLAVANIRIEAPIPGKAAIGIEVPNASNSVVFLKQVLTSEEYQAKSGNVVVGLGLDISGRPIIADICKTPHMLIAGATGSGKSVCINVIINSILFRYAPTDVKFVMIDPKRVELSCYNGLPHLLTPVVTDPKKASSALFWVVQEMDKRYEKLAKRGARDINRYNEIIAKDIVVNPEQDSEKLPFIIVIIDELADLMMVASKDVEDAICRIAQMGRAAGIHLVIGTQRPSVDVITGLIKANIPARIAFAVSSAIDSRTILDMSGAEKLLGKGDMLYAEPGKSKPIRVQGAYISEQEVADVVKSITNQTSAQYVKEDFEEKTKTTSAVDSDVDEYFNDAVKLIVDNNSASISMIQRRFRVGYARAARIIDQLEQAGIVGGYEGSKPRKVFADTEIVSKILNNKE